MNIYTKTKLNLCEEIGGTGKLVSSNAYSSIVLLKL